MGTLIRTVELECVNQFSNKFYHIHIEKEKGKYHVNGISGKIGSNGVTQPKGSYQTLREADKIVDNLSKTKQSARGYDLISDRNFPEGLSKERIFTLTVRAGFLMAEGNLSKEAYENIKSLLNSPEQQNWSLAEKTVDQLYSKVEI